MPWSGGTYTRTNGTYSGAAVWTSDASASINILANRHDTHDLDLASGINACLHKGGQNAATANINFGGFKPINVGNGTAATDAAAYGQTITSFTYSASTRVLTGVRAAGDITVTLPIFTASDAGLVPAAGAPTGRVLTDAGVFAGFAAGGATFPIVEVSTSQAVVKGTRYAIAANSITLTLPASPAFGDEVQFVPESTTYTSVVIARNGQPIMGLAEDMTLDGEGVSFALVYTDATNGWRIF